MFQSENTKAGTLKKRVALKLSEVFCSYYKRYGQGSVSVNISGMLWNLYDAIKNLMFWYGVFTISLMNKRLTVQCMKCVILRNSYFGSILKASASGTSNSTLVFGAQFTLHVAELKQCKYYSTFFLLL